MTGSNAHKRITLPNILSVPGSAQIQRDGAELVRSVLLAHPENNELDNGSIGYRQCRYQLIDEPVLASELDSIGAVFVDGSTWQFGMWPKETTETMRTRPVCFISSRTPCSKHQVGG